MWLVSSRLRLVDDDSRFQFLCLVLHCLWFSPKTFYGVGVPSEEIMNGDGHLFPFLLNNLLKDKQNWTLSV